MKISLIQLPTVALQLESYADTPISLGNVYNQIMPASLLRVASVLKAELDAEVIIEDLRIAKPERRETYKQIPWEGYTITAQRVGAEFESLDDTIKDSDWIGISSHFTFELRIVADFIRYAKRVNPTIKVMVGGADVRAQPEKYIQMGADLVCTGDIDPTVLRDKPKQRIIQLSKHPFDKLILPEFGLLTSLKEYGDSHDGPVPAGVQSPIAFLYFTRGCARECDFCESRRSGYEALNLKDSIVMLKNYNRAGISTLNIVDDNLLLQVRNKQRRQDLIELFRIMREIGFAWEFPNGLEVGMLAHNGNIDEELIDALFYHTIDHSGKITGAYRLYFPIETFDRRGDYRKLKALKTQTEIIRALSERRLSEIAFGTIIFPDADETTFSLIEKQYAQIREVVSNGSGNTTRVRYGIFHLIPIALHRHMKTKYADSELWNFYTPSYDGDNFSAGELFERRMDLTQRIDPANFNAMMAGKYGYG